MMRRILLLVVYAVLFMVIGRNIPFIPIVVRPPSPPSSNVLKKKVISYIQNKPAVFSIYYKNLQTGQEMGIDEKKVLTGASVNKIYIAEYLYSQAVQGKQNLESSVVIQSKDIQDYGTGSLRYEEPGKSYTLKTLALLSLRQSDNTAAHVLSVRLGPENIQKYVTSMGLVGTDMNDNKTTARDAGKALELLYTNKITSPALTHEVLGFLKDTDFEDRIPRDLTSDLNAYHKTGDGVRLVHDVGIIENAALHKSAVLVILTSDVQDEEKTKQAMSGIAQLIADSSLR